MLGEIHVVQIGDRIVITSNVKLIFEGKLLGIFGKFCDAYSYARDIADRFNLILEWDIVYAVILIKPDRLLISSRPEDCMAGEEVARFERFIDAYIYARDVADMYNYILEWYIEDELASLKETTIAKPVTI